VSGQHEMNLQQVESAEPSFGVRKTDQSIVSTVLANLVLNRLGFLKDWTSCAAADQAISSPASSSAE
jgi:hypothetical protein